jgi:hypothetical protein
MIHELEKFCNEVAVVCSKHGAQLLSEEPRKITNKRHKAGVRAEIRNEHNPNASLVRGELLTVYILHYIHSGCLSRLHWYCNVDKWRMNNWCMPVSLRRALVGDSWCTSDGCNRSQWHVLFICFGWCIKSSLVLNHIITQINNVNE